MKIVLILRLCLLEVTTSMFTIRIIPYLVLVICGSGMMKTMKS